MTALSYPNRNPPIAAAAAIITTWAMFTSPLLGASPVVDTSLLARFSPWPDLDHEHGPPCGSVPLAETAGFTPCLGAGVSGAEARGSDLFPFVRRVLAVYEDTRKYSLANPDVVKKAFIAATKLPDAVVEKQLYGRKYRGPARSAFILEADGTVLTVIEKVDTREHAEQLRAAVAGLGDF